MADVFISYARVDKEFVRKLHQGLEQIDRDIWIDWDDIPPTAEWRKEIFASIAAADNFLFIISPSSCASEMCREELAYAEACHKRLVPVVYFPVPQQDLPPALASIQWISFSDSPFDNAFQNLVVAIDTDVDWVHEHTRLLVRAREWEARNCDTSLLLRGKELLDAERWQSQSSSHEPNPVELQSKYLFASRQAQTRRHRSVLVGVSTALALTIVLAVFALWEWRQAKIQKDQAVSRQYAAQASQEFFTDRGAALRDAVTAASTARTSEAEFQLNAVLGGPQQTNVLHHKEAVYTAAFSPDGKRIVTASADKTARVWDASDGRLLATLSGHANPVHTAAFSPDGSRIVTASEPDTINGREAVDNTAKVWDAQTGRLLATLAGHTHWVVSACFSPDGKRIVTGSMDGTARLWDAETARLRATLAGPPKKRITQEGKIILTYIDGGHAEFSPDGRRILSTGAEGEGEPRIWDAEDGRLLATLPRPREWASNPVFSPDGKRIVTASSDGAMRILNAADGHLLATLKGHTDRVSSPRFSPDGKRIVTASRDGTVRIWDAADGHPLAKLTPEHEVYSAAFSPDSRYIVTAGEKGEVALWDAENDYLLAKFSGHTEGVFSATFSPDGTRVLTASLDSTARIWHIGDVHLLATLTGHTNKIKSALYSLDGKRIITTSNDRRARIWDAETGHLLAALGQSDPVGLAISGHSRDDLGQSDPVAFAMFSPDSKRIVTTSCPWREFDLSTLILDGYPCVAQVWDATDGHVLTKLNDDDTSLLFAVFSPDSRYIATVRTDSAVLVWNAGNGRLLATLNGHMHLVNSVKFSPDAKRIATASADNTARVWDAIDGRLLATLAGHTAPVKTAIFSPDGNRVMTSSEDKTVRIWDSANGHLLGTLTGHTGPVNSADFSPDGKRIVSASEDKTVRIWDGADPERFELIRKAGREAHGPHRDQPKFLRPSGPLHVVTGQDGSQCSDSGWIVIWRNGAIDKDLLPAPKIDHLGIEEYRRSSAGADHLPQWDVQVAIGKCGVIVLGARVVGDWPSRTSAGVADDHHQGFAQERGTQQRGSAIGFREVLSQQTGERTPVEAGHQQSFEGSVPGNVAEHDPTVVDIEIENLFDRHAPTQ